MKKVVSILTFTIIAILACVNTVNAADPTFTVTSEIDKIYGVAQSKEVTVYYSVKDFRNFETSATGGINVFEATLEFDDDVFEPITSDETTGAITSKTSEGEESILAQSGWTGLTYNAENKKLVIEKGPFVNKEEVILKVTLKVKPTAQVGNTTVKLKEMRATDQSKDVYPSNSEVSQTIEISSAISGEIINPDGGKYIRILPDMKVSEFIQLHPATKSITGLSNDSFIPTGSKTDDGFTLIAVGDINSDGKLTATDLSQLKAYEVGLLTNLNDDQKRATDVKWDGSYSTVDRSQLRVLMVKLGDPKISVWYGTGNAICTPVTPKY